MELRWLCLLILCTLSARCSGASNLPPSFTQDMDNLPLSESTPVGTVVYTLHGKDPEDLPIKYGLVGTDKFSVNPGTGDVTLVQPLDREMEDALKFFVSIEDKVPDSDINNLVQVPVTVIVLDENDNAPTFKNSPYEVGVAEDEAVGATVLRDILVEDQDSVGDNLEVGCEPVEQWPEACEIFELVSSHSSADQYTGALVLKRPLNYNDNQFYRFRLYASDGTLNSSAHVEVKVLDVQDTPPVFSGALNGALSEDAPVGTLALVVKARDGDKARPRDVIVELMTNPHDFFLLDAVSGELKTAKPLDREALADPSSPLNLTVRATELVNGVPLVSALTSTIATVTITIKDVNDEPPRFNRKEYFVEIPESLPPQTPLPNLDMFVTDRDVGINSVFSLRLSDKMGAFVVEPSTAAGSASVTLRLNSTLDYEDPNQRKFIVEVIAEELHTNPRLSSTASVTVSVTDVNDNRPQFAQSQYLASVPEDSTGGVFVTISATDRDTGRFGTEGIVYQLFGAGAELFQVDNRTGAFSVAPCPTPGVKPCLDIETKKDYYLNYRATDDDGEGQSTVVSVQISLLDANDNEPVFVVPSYRASIDEDAVKFEHELQVVARDADVTSDLRYSIKEEDSPFWVDPTSGKLGVKSNAVLPSTNHTSVVVWVSDGLHNASCRVEVTIRDVNNHAPVFLSQNYEAEVTEDAEIGTEVAQVSATDMDSGINSEIQYFIQKGAIDSFVVNNSTGVVTVSAKLDYDKRDTYRIQIIAADMGMPSLTGTTELTVHVINVNDKLPFFTPSIQRAEVSADAELDTVVHNLTASDPDVMDQHHLQYQLAEDRIIKAVDKNGKEVSEEGIFSNWFSVFPDGRVTVTQKLDRSRAAVLTLPVTVRDSSAATLQQADGELIITIVDVNRHAPVFSHTKFYEKFPEEQPAGTVLNTYTATDQESPIAAIVIDPPNEYFVMDNITGVVKTSKRIDYESVQSINFTIVAYDSGVPQRSSSSMVMVSVVNMDDEVPVFDQEQYEATVVENSEPDTLVLTVHATDKDLGKYGEITYNLTGAGSELFTMDPQTGQVRVGFDAVIDREQTREIWLRAVASDFTHRTTVPIHIQVLDVNDNAPIFSQKVYKSTIAENLRVEPPPAILQVRAEDKDDGLAGEVGYSILQQSEEGVFTVDPKTGIIYPSRSVTGNTTYHLTVVAKDEAGEGIHFDTAKVDIHVMSVNKHSPVFVVPGASDRIIEVPENVAQPDYLVTTVKATDEDLGENGRVSYYFKVDNQNMGETGEFTINRDTGELRTKSFLDRENMPEYQLVLVASDNGSPAQFETLHFLTVSLQQANDNEPKFPRQTYEFAVQENMPQGIIIGSVKAIDKDSGQFGKIYYHVLEGNNDGAFTLDRTQGLIRTNVSFDREVQSEYSLTVYASNNPVLERAAAILNYIDNKENATDYHEDSVAIVKIKILDENDNSPKFEQDVYYIGVKNTARINEPLLSVVATDPDYGENGTLSYIVAASNLYKLGASQTSGSVVPSPFNITQEGQLVTANYMAEYNQDRFVLDIIAQEVAPPHRQAKTQVYVWIIERSSLIRVVSGGACGAGAGGSVGAGGARGGRLAERVLAVSGARLVPAAGATVSSGRCEFLYHAVDPTSHRVLPVERVLEQIDAKYDQLRDVYSQYGVETVIAASSMSKLPESFDPALAALIALLIVLFTGIVTFIVVCACLRHWTIPPPSMESSKGDSLSRRRILEELSTTENPLWLETKLRPYEEQELTMNVFGDQPDHNIEQAAVDNTYATIPGRGGGGGGSAGGGRFPEYDTLPAGDDDDLPTPLEAAMGFQGSTFKPPTAATPEPPPRPSALQPFSW